MKCPKCGYENDDNAYFCEGCVTVAVKVSIFFSIENLPILLSLATLLKMYSSLSSTFSFKVTL